MLLLLLACTGSKPHPPADDTAGDDTGRDNTATDDTATTACPDGEPPVVGDAAWEQAGLVPAVGMHTLAGDGSWPVWVGSHATGVWRADEDLLWDDSLVTITHTLSEIAIEAGNPDHAFRSSGGRLQRTTDGGLVWTDLTLGSIDVEPLDEVWAISVTPWQPERILVVMESGASWVSEDDGETFTFASYAPIREPPIVEDPFAVWGWRLLSEPEVGGRVLLTDAQGVMVSDDGMASWTRTLDAPVGGYSLLRDPLDPAHLVVGGEDAVYTSEDGGDTWSTVTIAGDVAGGSWASDGSWLALVGEDGSWTSTDAVTFTEEPHTLHMPMAALIQDDGRLLVANHMGVAVSEDRGVTWADASEGLVDRGMSVVAADPTCPARVFAASRCGGGVFSSDDYGTTWSAVDEYFHYVMEVSFDPIVADRVWAVSDDRLMRSDDAGVTWDEVWKRYHFHGFAVHPEDPDLLLLGSVAQGVWADTSAHVYRSEDGGETWGDSSTGLPESEASAHVIRYWPGNSDVVILGTYKGGDVSHATGEGVGLWRSADGGETWSQVAPDAQDIAALAEADGRMFAGTEDGILVSEDEGLTWTSVPGPATWVLGLIVQGDVGLAYAFDGKAWKSTDGGYTWEVLDDGLPPNPNSWLAQVSISADGTIGYVTVFDGGVYRLGL